MWNDFRKSFTAVDKLIVVDVYSASEDAIEGVNSKAFVSWAGIKGAVPIVFAFYPLVYQIPGANLMFNIVLVTTCISVLLQGSTLKFMAKRFNLLDD